MKANTIRQIHSILPGAFAAAQRWEWVDLDRGNLHIAFNYVVRGGQRVRKDTKTHQERFNAIDPDTCAFIREHLDAANAALAPARPHRSLMGLRASTYR